MSMNQPQPLLKVSSSTAKQLEGYLSIGTDLQYVMRVTHTAVQFIETGPQDDFTLPTYLSASLVAYARPFSDGVRGSKSLKLVAAEVYAGIEGAEDLHEYLINQRNKLIAHSVNPFESVHAGIVMNDQGRPTSVGYFSSRLVSFKVEDYKQFNQLTKIALEATNQKISKVEKLLLAEVTKYSDKELRKLKPARFVVPPPDKAQESRRNPK